MIWAYTVFFGSRLVTMVSTAILARLLVPEDFGLIGYALILLSFVEATQDMGIKDALIYSSDRVEDTADTAFIINAVLGFVQYAIAFLVAPLALHIFDDPRIVPMVRVMALAFVFNALANTHDGLLQKELEFRKRYTPDVYSAVIKGAASIALALFGYGVWSLVAGHVIGSIVRMVAKWMLQPWRPRFRFHMDRARALWSFGVFILLYNLLGVGLSQASQMFIGALLGAVQLGYYTIAARLPEMVLINFSLVLTHVLFPAYAKVKDDRARLTAGFFMATKYTAFVTLPIGLGMVVVAPELVRVVFGTQWDGAIILAQVLAVLGMVATLPWSAGDVFKALGRPDVATKLLLIEALYTFPLVAVFTIETRLAVMACLANVIAAIITTFLRLGLAARFLKFNPLEYYFLFRSPFYSAFVMSGVVIVWRMLMADRSDLLVLVTSIGIGGVVYGLLLWLMEREEVNEAIYMLQSALRRRAKEPVAEAVDVA